MASLSHGMNIEEVTKVGNSLQKTYAADISGFVTQIEQLVNQTQGAWIGPDADTFRSWWPAKRSKLVAIADDLHGFGQSALNNAEEQRQASGAGGSTSTVPPGGPGSPAPAPAPGGSSTGVGSTTNGELDGSHRTKAEVQQAYERIMAGSPWGPGGASDYECVAWANFRWKELGYSGPGISGNGNTIAGNAGGSLTTPPSLGAMGSYGTGDGHVFIVEEISDDGGRIRISEMNRDRSSGPSGISSDRVLVRQPNGSWLYSYERDASAQRQITFATFPG